MRDIDRLTAERFAIPTLLLMEAAANESFKLIFSHFDEQLSGRRITIFCGPGNNGGDGAALARMLLLRGARVKILLLGDFEKARGDARVNFAASRALLGNGFQECPDETTLENYLSQFPEQELFVDALFGTGLTRPLEGMYARAVEYLNDKKSDRSTDQAAPFVFSLDIPSGLNADQAELIGPAINADLTITFTAPKPANVLPPANLQNGILKIVPVGSPDSLVADTPSKIFLLEHEDAAQWLKRTRYLPGSYKNSHGHALIIAGSRNYTGAAILSANAAMRSGAGLVTLAAPTSALASIVPRLMPEVMTVALAETEAGAVSENEFETVLKQIERVDVIAIGPGLSSAEESTRNFVQRVIRERKKPVVVDADALNALAPWPDDIRGHDAAPIVLTPHLGEMRRLLALSENEAIQDRVKTVGDFSTLHQLIMVLKGTRILLGSPDGHIYLNPSGNAGSGTAGAGDTLTGIIAGFIAQAKAQSNQQTVLEATQAAVFTAGIACDLAAQMLGMRAMVASDIREYLPAAIRSLDPEGESPL